MIVDIIKAVSDSMTHPSNLPWIFKDAEMHVLNVNAGSEDSLQPFCYFVHNPVETNDRVDNKSGQVQEEFKFTVMLMEQSVFSWEQARRNEILERMYAAKYEFIKKLLLRPEVDEITGSSSEEFFNAPFDHNFDGLWLKLRVKLNPDIFC